MASAAIRESERVLRHPARDALFLTLAVAHGVVLLAWPSIAVVALGLWWNANTIAHNFIHRPFFRSRTQNRLFSAYLSLLMGVPQTLWRRRHLAHHRATPSPRGGKAAAVSRRGRLDRDLTVETTLVAALWIALVGVDHQLFLATYLPGWLIGLGLCQLQGHYEHDGGTTSHYGRVYNLLFFNDGYHVEHHASPAEDWRWLASRREPSARGSRWPAVLRWIDAWTTAPLDGLERLVLLSPRLQRFVLRAHERAFRRLLSNAGDVRSALIVGGGLFPRTALVLRHVLPEASLTMIDADASHLARARRFVGDAVNCRCERYDPQRPAPADLVVVPLADPGDRREIYARPQARLMLVHDWIWASRGEGVVISWLLLKRLNLVTSASQALRQAV